MFDQFQNSVEIDVLLDKHHIIRRDPVFFQSLCQQVHDIEIIVSRLALCTAVGVWKNERHRPASIEICNEINQQLDIVEAHLVHLAQNNRAGSQCSNHLAVVAGAIHARAQGFDVIEILLIEAISGDEGECNIGSKRVFVTCQPDAVESRLGGLAAWEDTFAHRQEHLARPA